MILYIIAAATPLVPASKWVVDYADRQCVASRRFDDRGKPLTLAIKPSPTSDVIQLNLLRPGSAAGGTRADAAISFGKAPPLKIMQLSYGTRNVSIRQINLAANQAALLAAATTVGWEASNEKLLFDTGSIAPVLKALATCRADLRDYWNITPERSAKLKSKVASDASVVSLFSTNDYPAQALMKEQSGMTSVVLLIDEAGKVAECMIDGTSGIAVLDAQSCIIVRSRGKFRAAIGEDGKPARSHFVTRIRWELGQ